MPILATFASGFTFSAIHPRTEPHKPAPLLEGDSFSVDFAFSPLFEAGVGGADFEGSFASAGFDAGFGCAGASACAGVGCAAGVQAGAGVSAGGAEAPRDVAPAAPFGFPKSKGF